MTDQILKNPDALPFDVTLQKYLTSSNFLPNNIWKTTFSPCSQYLAITKQDIYGDDCVVIISCPNWHANRRSDELYVHVEFKCSSPVWSLAFGERKLKDENILSTSRRSSLSVNCRYDFTKNLFLAAGLADGKINIWNIDTGELTLILTDHKSTVCGLAFTSNTMQLASCSYDTKIKLWDLLDDGNMYKTLDQWTHVINTVKWSPDEKLLCAVGPHELVVLYDTIIWKELFKLDGHEHNVVDCAFSSDSTLLATASYDTRVLLWSTITGELLKEFAHKIPIPLKIYAGGDNGSFVRSVIFTKYDQFLITTCDDNYVRWFSVDSSLRRKKSFFQRSQNNVLCVAATSNGQTLALGTRTGEVHLWSQISTKLTAQPPSLKNFCRILINTQAGSKRKEILNLPISQSLIKFLLYKNLKVK